MCILSFKAPPKIPALDKKGEEKAQDKPAVFELPKLKSVPRKDDLGSSKSDKPSDNKPVTPPKVEPDRRSSDSTKGEEKSAEVVKKPSLKEADKPNIMPRPSKTALTLLTNYPNKVIYEV